MEARTKFITAFSNRGIDTKSVKIVVFEIAKKLENKVDRLSPSVVILCDCGLSPICRGRG